MQTDLVPYVPPAVLNRFILAAFGLDYEPNEFKELFGADQVPVNRRVIAQLINNREGVYLDLVARMVLTTDEYQQFEAKNQQSEAELRSAWFELSLSVVREMSSIRTRLDYVLTTLGWGFCLGFMATTLILRNTSAIVGFVGISSIIGLLIAWWATPINRNLVKLRSLISDSARAEWIEERSQAAQRNTLLDILEKSRP